MSQWPMVIHNLGHEPVLVESESHRKRLMKERGLHDSTYHVGLQGSDKAPHTQSFDVGSAPGVDNRLMQQMSPEDQEKRRIEWWWPETPPKSK